MIVSAITWAEVGLLGEGEYLPGSKATWDHPGDAPEVELVEVSSLFVDVRRNFGGGNTVERVDLLAGVDRKSEAWRVLQANISAALGDVISEGLAEAGADWEPERWEA